MNTNYKYSTKVKHYTGKYIFKSTFWTFFHTQYIKLKPLTIFTFVFHSHFTKSCMILAWDLYPYSNGSISTATRAPMWWNASQTRPPSQTHLYVTQHCTAAQRNAPPKVIVKVSSFPRLCFWRCWFKGGKKIFFWIIPTRWCQDTWDMRSIVR